MSKYNNATSISFSELPEEEIEQAIKEWAQGSEQMEKLLWACRDNGIETMGCHPLGRPYLEIAVNNSHNKISRMLNVAQNIPGTVILVSPDGGNPLSGDSSWYRPNILIGFNTCSREEVAENLDKLYKAITAEDEQDTSKDNVFSQMLDLHDFFADKESGLLFYMRRLGDGSYDFSITHRTDYRFDDISQLLNSTGMEQGDMEWTISDTNLESFNKKVAEIKRTLKEGYSLGLPDELTPDMGLNMMAHVMKRKCGDSSEGRQKFNNWFGDFKEKLKLVSAKKLSPEDICSWSLEFFDPKPPMMDPKDGERE